MADFDDEDELLRDITPEEMTESMKHSSRFVAQTFLNPKHYQTIHQTLSSKWDRYHSLSAAIKLMETYGVTLSASEERRLAGLEESQQINALVSKMPQQSNDQFQQFFLQLQLLVSTAMRVRQSLEEGRPDDVAAALQDADATGISSYILNVAIVQAGSEIKTLKNQFSSWTAEADNKMGRLLRGQQDNITAQKQLAQAEAELAKQNGEQCTKTARVVMNFAAKNDTAFKTTLLQGWSQATKFLRLEALLRVEYADRLKDLEDNLAKVKQGQLSKCENIVLKKIHQENLSFMGITFDSWRKDVEDDRFMKENGEKLKALEEKLSNAKVSQKDNAQKVMAGMATKSDQGLLSSCLKGWIQVRLDSIRQKKAGEERVFAESKLDQFAKNKSEEAKYVIQKFAGQSDTGLLHTIFSSWADHWAEKKAEAEVAEQMYKSKNKMDNFKGKNKKATGSLMNRASDHIQNLLLTRCINSWRTDSKLESAMRTYQLRIDAKRTQLVGVQQMFRNFASQLEGGLKEGSGQESSRNKNLFENNTRVNRKMNKGDGAVSLPDIHGKQQVSGRKEFSSGRSARSKQMSSRKGSHTAEQSQVAWG